MLSCTTSATDAHGSQAEAAEYAPSQDTLTMEELQVDIQQLQKLVKEKEAASLSAFLKVIVHKWTGGQAYFRQFLEASRQVLEEGAEPAIVKSYLSNLLARPQDIQVVDGYYLMDWFRFCMQTADPVTTEDSTFKNNLVKAESHFEARYLQDLDPKFDPSKFPMLNISPPAATGMPGGVDPSAIKDLALRQEYLTAIDQEAKYAEHYRYQMALRSLKQNYPQLFHTR